MKGSGRTMKIGWVGLAAVAAVALGGCGDKVLDQADVESNVKKVVAEEVGQEPKRIECPDDLKAEVGEKMTCTLVADDDSEVDVTVTVTEVDGDNAKYDVEVGEEVRTN
jgi:hypothetical protein